MTYEQLKNGGSLFGNPCSYVETVEVNGSDYIYNLINWESSPEIHHSSVSLSRSRGITNRRGGMGNKGKVSRKNLIEDWRSNCKKLG